jgi:SAM-dependent methyltransferase
MDDIAPDGSPVAVYLALPADVDIERIRAVLPTRAAVLDLGSGPGCIANPLVAAGHTVTAVDDSLAMLAHVVGAKTVLADVWSLDLGRRFDAVLALSHLVNAPTRERRLGLLRVCRRHLTADGIVVIQRYPPSWVPTEGTNAIGRVTTRLHDVVDRPDGFAAAVTYVLRDQSWTQHFAAAIVDDTELASLAAASDLEVLRALDEAGAWVLLGATRLGAV